MKKLAILLLAMIGFSAMAQLKTRPDALPPQPDTLAPKEVAMASTIEEMYDWDKYPTYDTYVSMMQMFADSFPSLCHLDTIGLSLRNRLILSLVITAPDTKNSSRPEFFYSSTIHGDEVAGYYLMLRLCDTLLRSYGTSEDITELLNHVKVYINPLANPDGTYIGGNNSLAMAQRYNANNVDLNRNYPDPFGTDPLSPVQQENLAMIDYFQSHHFLLSANLHGGSEVMNYPWDSFTSREQLNEYHEWWKAVSKRFVDTCRVVAPSHFKDVCNAGYINGGDWYVIPNGRQDYVNYYHNCREITMELSTQKKLSSSRLPEYWNFESHALINYIKEIYSICDTSASDTCQVAIQQLQPREAAKVYPNPTRGKVTIETSNGIRHFDLGGRPAGVYIINVEGRPVRVIKF